MENKLISQLTTIAELYYMQGLTQQEISQRVHIHRSEISRLLKEARKLGLVQITVNSNVQSLNSLQEFLIKQFHLKDALVVPESTESLDLQILGEFAAQYLSKNIASNSVIGVSWGRSLAHTIQSMPAKSQKHGITVVPLIGGPTGRLKNDYQSNRLVYIMAEKLNAKSESLNCPALVSSKALKDELVANPNTQVVLNYWKELDYALVGIGSNSITNLTQWKEFYKDSNFTNVLRKTNSVGDILSRPFIQDGKIINSSKLNVVGLDLNSLKDVPNVVGIACGKNKVKSILGALNTGVLDVLITTDITALGIKSLCTSKSQM